MHKRYSWMIALICAQAWGTQANTDSSLAGKLLYEQFRCAECHGADGKTRPARNVPPLAGMNPDHIFTKTQRFIESRAHENVLQGCGEPPSPIQIKKISDYLATLSR